MNRLVIHKLGPITHCELDLSHFTVLTGFQASGKSTIAKCVFFFRTIKDDLYRLAIEAEEDIAFQTEKKKLTLKQRLIQNLRLKFLKTFGSSWAMDNTMNIRYTFTEDCWVRVRLKEDTLYANPNYIYIEFSSSLEVLINDLARTIPADTNNLTSVARAQLHQKITSFFQDEKEIVYIPAGRSMITLLSDQLNYIYSTMKEEQKRSIDYCTQDYIERVLRLKAEFSSGLGGLIEYYSIKTRPDPALVSHVNELMKKILKGNYFRRAGEEGLTIDGTDKYVKINYASSGQQESVWILNLLDYGMIRAVQTLFIIEEPESHLFPESQKYITELIALAANQNHSILLTTHSPYVLGTLNNLLYAAQAKPDTAEKVSQIIHRSMWLERQRFGAWFIKDGEIENGMDQDLDLIQNEKIDEISKTINEDYDSIFDLQNE